MPLIENKIFSHRSVGRETKREDLPRKVGLKKKDQLVINKDQSQEAENSIGNEGTDVEHIELVEPEKWIERLTVCATHTLSLPSEYIDDDAQREEAFVNHSRKSVDDALLRLERLGIPWQRPVNYYAEMMKSDVHMHRVQEELERSEEVIRRRAQRRQESYQRKFSKELKSEHAKKEAERKRKLAIAVETTKRRSARRMKEEGATSRLFGAIIPSRGSRGKGYDYDGEDDDMDADRGESRYPVRKNRRQTGKQYPNASGGNKERNRTLGRRSGVSKKRPGKVARRRRQN